MGLPLLARAALVGKRSQKNAKGALASGNCHTTHGQRCIFPVKYKGKTYNENGGCINGSWCATKTNSKSEYSSWDYCKCAQDKYFKHLFLMKYCFRTQCYKHYKNQKY